MKLKILRFFYKFLYKLHLIKKKRFYYEPFIYTNLNGVLLRSGMSSSVRFFESFIIEDFLEEDADKRAFIIINNKYPDYKGFINLF